VAAIETFLFVFTDGPLACAVVRCDAPSVDFSLLALLGVVLAVRFLFLAGEHALLVRLIEYYQRHNSATLHLQQTPKPATGEVASQTYENSPSAPRNQETQSHQPGDGLPLGFKRNPKAFMYDSRKLLGGANAWTIHVLIAAVSVLVVTYASSVR
jgi:hypothetical protein